MTMTMNEGKIKCGNCSEMHGSVEEVRSCHSGAKPSPKFWALSEKQATFLDSLLGERDWSEAPEATRDLIAKHRSSGTLAMREARETITALLDCPKSGSRPSTASVAVRKVAEAVPAGRYAFWWEGAEDVLRFWEVSKPSDGRWAGFTFVRELTGAPGSFRERRVVGSERIDVLKAIAEDPQTASIVFGREVGQCGVCHSPLTNEDSRKYGIGPTCRAKMGW